MATYTKAGGGAAGTAALQITDVTTSPGPGRVLIALGNQNPLAPAPTWTRYDNLANINCYGFDCSSGRSSELDITDTGTARVYFHDVSGVLDSDTLVGKQIMLQLWDPNAAAWVPRWRGHIDDINHDLESNSDVDMADVQIECVDIFDYLGGVHFLPWPDMGDDPSLDASLARMVGSTVYFVERVDDRIIALCADANLASSMVVPFTGNVNLAGSLYEYSDVVLQALRDAADAEFPGVANVYVDRFGRVVFHGRFARFDPEGTANGANWQFTRWQAGTREDVTSGVAQIRGFAFNRPRDRIINSYSAWPAEDANGYEFRQSLIKTLIQTDAASISSYGFRGREAPSLRIRSNFNNGNTGAQECSLYGDFYVTNYAQPRKAIRSVTFKAVMPDDPVAAATWALMTRVDVSDAINLTVDEAGLANVPFFVDGVGVSCRVANTTVDYVEVTPNLTPASYYGTNVFNP